METGIGKSERFEERYLAFIQKMLSPSRYLHCLLWILLCVPVGIATGADSAENADSLPSGSVKKIVSIQPDILEKGFRVQITADGKFEDFNAFRLMDPHRIVVDLPNVRSSNQTFAFFSSPLVENVRVRNVSTDKVRIVIDMIPRTEVPYRVSSQEKQLTVVLGALDAKPAAKSTRATAAGSAARPGGDLPQQVKKAPVKHATTITSVEMKRIDGGVNIYIFSDGSIARYSAFQLTSPARLVLDLFGVQYTKRKQTLPSGDPTIERVRIASYPKDKTRVVIDLASADIPSYRVIPGDGGILFSMKQPSHGSGSESKVSTQPAQPPGGAEEEASSVPLKVIPEKALPADASGGTLLHVSSFREKANGEKEARRLGTQGYPSFLEEKDVLGLRWFRVYIGPFKDRQQARRVGLAFREKELIPYFKLVEAGQKPETAAE